MSHGTTKPSGRAFTCDAPTPTEPVLPPKIGSNSPLSPEDIAALKVLAKMVPAINQLLNAGRVEDEEESEALPGPSPDNVPGRTLDSRARRVGYDIYTQPEHRKLGDWVYDNGARGASGVTHDEGAPAPLGFDIYTQPEHRKLGDAMLQESGQGLIYR